ncbi:MAG TPA: N-acetylglucosamine-6-phosphate deacetylase [Chitinophagaceae bacterium]|nr:N-acetylglucosamine-6-phosphate deacetylase [Chitinophagaceae bacterium]
MKAYSNARVFTGTSFLTHFTVLTEDGMITGLVAPESIPAGAEVIDLQQHILAPAFIDIQIYGGNGSLFSHDLSAASLQSTYEHCLAGGTAQCYITLATNSMEVFYRGIDAVRAYWAKGGKGIPGLHLEGPYLNPLKKGAHLEQYIKKPTVQEVSELLQYGKDVIKIMTIAPEQCSDEVITLLLESGIMVSAGHSNASYEEGYAAFERGIPAATHLFNAMSPLQHRAPGLVGAIFNHPEVMSSIVPDGIHVDFAALRISKKIMQQRLFVITDAVTATTEGDYPHVFQKDRYVLPNGTLSGSALTMMKAVKNLVSHAGIEMGEALRMASLYPAQLMKQDSKWGRIEKGHAADLVEFDEAFNVVNVYTH